MQKQINMLAFLLGLALVFPMFAEAAWVKGDEVLNYTSGCYQNAVSLQSTTCVGSSNMKEETALGQTDCPEGTWGRFQRITYQCIWEEDPPPDPGTCGNGSLDGDEVGIDCGGSCSAECVYACPSDQELREWAGYPGSYYCAYVISPTNGLCPSGYILNTSETECHQLDDETPELGSQEYFDLNPPQAGIEQNPGFEVIPWQEEWSYGPETVADNGDGTETASLEVVTTESDGTVTTTDVSVQRPSGSPTGTGFASTGDGGIAPAPGYEGTVSTGDNQLVDPNIGQGISIAVQEAPAIDFQPIYDLQQTLSGRFPISLIDTASNILSGFNQTPSAPRWDMQFPNPWGGSIPFSIDLEPMAPLATVVRTFLDYFVLLCVFWLIYRRWV